MTACSNNCPQAIIRNITIEQGADFDCPFDVVDASGNPVNISGATAAMQIALSFGTPAVVTLTTANGGLFINGPAGTITPFIDESMTAGLVPGIYLYDVKLLFANGSTTRPFQGTATVNAEITTITPPSPSVLGELNFTNIGNSGLAAGVL